MQRKKLLQVTVTGQAVHHLIWQPTSRIHASLDWIFWPGGGTPRMCLEPGKFWALKPWHSTLLAWGTLGQETLRTFAASPHRSPAPPQPARAEPLHHRHQKRCTPKGAAAVSPTAQVSSTLQLLIPEPTTLTLPALEKHPHLRCHYHYRSRHQSLRRAGHLHGDADGLHR